MRAHLIGAFCAAAFIGLAANATPSHATILHPWCYDGTGNEAGVPICGYDSYEQCLANAGTCVANPAMDPLPRAPAKYRAFRWPWQAQ